MLSKYLRIAAFHIFLGFIFAFFYSQLTIPEFKEFRLRIEDIRGEKKFDLPEKEAYLLKLWGDDIIDSVYVNSVLIPHSIFRSRKKLQEFYYILPLHVVKAGTNTLEVSPPRRCSLRIKNCISATAFGVILPKNSRVNPQNLSTAGTLFAVFCSLVYGVSLFALLIKFFDFPFTRFLLKYTLSYLPCLVFLWFIYQASFFIPFKTYFLKDSFLGLCIFLVGIFQAPLVFSFLIKEGFIYMKAHLRTAVAVSTSDFLKSSRDKLTSTGKDAAVRFVNLPAVQWFLNRAFSDKCLIIFLVSLFLDAFLLSFGFEFLAEVIANAAYFALAIGIIIKLRQAGPDSKNA